MIRPQLSLDLHGELIVDNFAGGGGASTGIELALGRCVDLAINHDPEALAMHEMNHPQTRHLPENIWHVDPVKETAGRPVGLLWLSPDCKHFSKAKGGKPREKKIRGLALIGLNWVRTKRPRVMILENVEEFQTWGPLLADGTLNPKCKGQMFRAYVGWLRRRGYVVEWRELRACEYGAPTIRKRLFLIARCDGTPITWPAPTHGAPGSPEVKAGKLQPWRTAAECIEWARPCPSIFERKRELAAATCRRIAKGIMRYVVNCADPFIVPLTHHDSSDRVTTMGQPVPTVTGANRGEMALVAPVLTEHANASNPRCNRADVPLRTQCAQVKGGHFALIAPTLVGAGGPAYQGKPRPADQPAHTLTAENHAALVTAFLAKHYGGHETPGWPLQKPASTITAVDHHGLVTGTLVGVGGRAGQSRPRGGNEPVQTITAKADTALLSACLVPRYGERAGQEPRALDIKAPAPTVVPTGNGGSLVAAHLTKFRTGSTGSDCAAPLHTITAGPKENPAGAPHAMGLVAAHLSKLRGDPESHAPGQEAGEPLHTVSAQGNHFADVRAFLIKYYGNETEAHAMADPIGTVTARDRFGLVTVNGEEYAIADIGLRMLAPSELFKAQGFPGRYIIDRGVFEDKRTGLREIRPLTKSAQVRMCGNSVCPPLAEALVRANVPELSAWTKDDRKRRTA
jgi:DNA (cytosine-5)-methyltransferase 1